MKKYSIIGFVVGGVMMYVILHYLFQIPYISAFGMAGGLVIIYIGFNYSL